MLTTGNPGTCSRRDHGKNGPIHPQTTSTRKDEIRQQLLDYCSLDLRAGATLATFRWSDVTSMTSPRLFTSDFASRFERPNAIHAEGVATGRVVSEPRNWMRHFVSSSKRLLLRRQVLKERGCFRPALGCQLNDTRGPDAKTISANRASVGTTGLSRLDGMRR